MSHVLRVQCDATDAAHEPIQVVGRSPMPCTIAVVSDGSPGRSRVVIAGAATMPVLRPLLLAAGFGCVNSWDRRDTVTFPLRWITRNAEAVVDLLGCTQELAEAASDHPELIIITPDETSWTRRARSCAELGGRPYSNSPPDVALEAPTTGSVLRARAELTSTPDGR